MKLRVKHQNKQETPPNRLNQYENGGYFYFSIDHHIIGFTHSHITCNLFFLIQPQQHLFITRKQGDSKKEARYLGDQFSLQPVKSHSKGNMDQKRQASLQLWMAMNETVKMV